MKVDRSFSDLHWDPQTIGWENCFTTSTVFLDTTLGISDRWRTLCDTYRGTLYVKS